MTDAHDSTTAVHSSDEAQPFPTHFGLKADECTADGLRRIVLEQVDLATWHTLRVGVADEHVHGVRRATKRVRAVLRMVRVGLGEDLYRHDNAVLRDVARDLSALRSATVRVETLDALVEWRGPLAASVAGMHDILATDAARMRAEPPLIDGLVDRLQGIRASVSGWTLPHALVPTTLGFGRTYRRGRRAMAKAYADGSTKRFHEWRKRVKYLRHQMEVLTAVWPETMHTITEGFVELGDGLGLDHDLADLGFVVDTSSVVFVSLTVQGELLDAIAQRRKEVQADLRPLAERLYAQTTRDFVRDMTTYWDEWGREAPSDAGLRTMREADLR
jgi:CHAD domain-containing protein